MKFKSFIFALLFSLLGMILGACCFSTSYADQEHPLKIWKQNDNGRVSTYNLVDEATGNNYIVVVGGSNHTDCSIAITPRLKFNGDIYNTR